MFEMLLKLYKKGKLTEAALNNAVKKNWITESQKALIMEE